MEQMANGKNQLEEFADWLKEVEDEGLCLKLAERLKSAYYEALEEHFTTQG